MSLKFGVLGLLANDSLHGYEAKTRFEALLGGTTEVNIGQVYATLQRLERDGLIAAVGARGDRGRQQYELTDAGRAALDAWIEEPVVSPQQLRDEIYMKLLFSERIANGRRPALLLKQRRVFLQQMKQLSELDRRIRAEGREDLALLIRGALLHTEADLKWVDELLSEDKA
ncbi:MAG: PadR family transcriptional regulator [Candidatus Dormibacteraeota bacterium]|nr:PadR family transcriptional regulator [Candidatus Dormibacteraeota bacterium]